MAESAMNASERSSSPDRNDVSVTGSHTEDEKPTGTIDGPSTDLTREPLDVTT